MGAEHLLCPLSLSDGSDGVPRLWCCREGGDGNNIFSIVLSAALTAAAIKVTKMFPIVLFVGILTTMFLLSCAITLTLHPH